MPALALGLVLSACSLATWRHTFELRSEDDVVQLDVWMGANSFGDAAWWCVLVDSWLFPMDAALGTFQATRSALDPDLAVVAGPIGWLWSLLPFVTVLPPMLDAYVPDALDHQYRGGEPKVFHVTSEQLRALRAAPEPTEFEALVRRAVAVSLPQESSSPPYDGSRWPRPLTRESWERYCRGMVQSISLRSASESRGDGRQ